MPPIVARRPLLLAMVLATLGFGRGGASPQQPVADKLDPAVRAAMDAGQGLRVLVLGAQQLFEPVGGFAAFQLEHAQADRRVLRTEVIARLQRNAAREQAAIREALGIEHPVRTLWILNAMLVDLSAEQLRRAEQLEHVLYVYAVSDQPAAPATSPTMQAIAAGDPAVLPSAATIGWNLDSLGVTRVWRELGITGEGILVASIDGGFNYTHADLRGRWWHHPGEVPGNDRDDDGNGYPDDVHGWDFLSMRPELRNSSGGTAHGTMTAGIIVGDGTGGIATGVAPGARILGLVGSRVTDAALAYEYALVQGADVISMSFSIPNLGNLRGAWRMMSEHAIAAGAVLVGGAGNFRTSATLPYQHQSPKDVPGVISVGGVDSTLALAPFSSGGPAEWGTVALYGDHPLPAGITKPDVVAFPGAGYPVLAQQGDSGYVQPNLRIRGNSFSGPQGAGVAALMLSAAPNLPAWRVKEILERTARDLGLAGRDNDFGHGLIDAYSAVREAQRFRR
jgi:serine protease AprX